MKRRCCSAIFRISGKRTFERRRQDSQIDERVLVFEGVDGPSIGRLVAADALVDGRGVAASVHEGVEGGSGLGLELGLAGAVREEADDESVGLVLNVRLVVVALTNDL